MVYVKTKEAKKQLGVTDGTLRKWASNGRIKFVRAENGGSRLYDIGEFILKGEGKEDAAEKEKYIYCRVSSHSQKEDLERQIAFLKEKYPEHTVISDIGSGINFKRKGLNKILAQTFAGTVQEIVVAHKDRLCRVAWDHFEWMFRFHGVNIIVEDKQEYSPESEFSDDLFSIIHVFSSRHYGLRRKYTSKESKENKTREQTETRK